ncbi:MAG: hypothetical protein IPL53_12825 [Ignavibacteria bacterium]|nr:hypothetical protein [Ignavibacteria bacterium]
MKFFIDTGIFSDHLNVKRADEISLLEKTKSLFDGCYTSVINASEIFSECSGKRAILKAKTAFEDIGILGIPFRYSLKTGEVMKVIKKKEQVTL